MRSQDLRKLCTAAEYKLLQSAAVRNIVKLNAVKLRPALKRAEALAGKLKTQAKKAVKAKAAAAKSKANAFESAAKRLRARLVKLETAAVSRVAGKKKTARKAVRAKAATAKQARAKTAAPKPASRPAAKVRRMVRGAAAASPASMHVVKRNPLTHRGTKPSRTQVLFEHQGSPVEPASHPASPGVDAAHESNLGELVRNAEVRNQTLLSRSARSRGKVTENHLAATANARIRGHASGAGRRAQGRRDAAQRGEKRPDKPGFDN